MVSSFSVVQLSFIIATNGSGAQGAVTVATESMIQKSFALSVVCNRISTLAAVTASWVNKSNSEFDFTWPLVGVTSYTGAPSKWPTLYINTSANVVYTGRRCKGYLFASLRILRGFRHGWCTILTHHFQTRNESEISKCSLMSGNVKRSCKLVDFNFERTKEWKSEMLSQLRDNRIGMNWKCKVLYSEKVLQIQVRIEDPGSMSCCGLKTSDQGLAFKPWIKSTSTPTSS